MRQLRIAVAFALLLALPLACGRSRTFSIGSDCDGGFCSEGPAVTPAPLPPPVDSGADADAPSSCPTSDCIAPFTTCPSSSYRCDVDLSKDGSNCGACSNQCRDLPEIFAREACVNGSCLLRCLEQHANCDGILDNGCETDLTERQNCGACGNACGEGVPCTRWGLDSTAPWACGCPTPFTNCGGSCVDLESDYKNCGQCDNICIPPPILPPGGQFLCVFGECKVVPPLPDTPCPSGKPPKRDIVTGALYCECPSGLTDCSTNSEYFECVDFASDKKHCGGCGRICAEAPSATGACLDGRCELLCRDGTYDCNGWIEDGCETNIKSDPRNCGACGNACAAVGQPCVDGVCATAPCEVAQ